MPQEMAPLRVWTSGYSHTRKSYVFLIAVVFSFYFVALLKKS